MTGQIDRISRIALIGEGYQVWPVAALLCQNLLEYIDLVVVEECQANGRKSALALPLESRFHHQTGLDAKAIMQSGNVNFGLGTECKDWQGEGGSFFVAPSGSPPLIGGFPLHQIMHRASYSGNGPADLAHLLKPFRFCARAAMDGKFALPSDAPQSPTLMLGPRLQMERSEYAALFKEQCKGKISEHMEAHCTGVNINAESEVIESVILEDRQEPLVADLFIDVSGSLSDLIPQAGIDRQSLGDVLPFDSQISDYDPVRVAEEHQNVAAQAMRSGIMINTPLREGMVTDILFSAAEMEQEIGQKEMAGLGEVTPFKAFQTENPWTGNLVRMGGTSASLGPYQSADIRLLQEQTLRLIALIPNDREMNAEAVTFNRKHRETLEEIRDFTILPLVLNQREDRLWSRIREASLPASLRLRIDQFVSRGRFVPYDHELIDQQTWIETMIGFGLVPQRHDPRIDAIEMKPLVPRLRQLVDEFTRTIESMQDHYSYLENFRES